MDHSAIVVLCLDALYLALVVSMPILLTGVVVGLGVGLFQALTQIQEQTTAIILKMIAMALAAAWLFPWATTKLIEFSRQVFQNIPDTLNPFL